MRSGRWAGALAVVVLAGVAATVAEAATTETVKLEGNSFSPREINIVPGDTVKWEYVSGGNHTVTFDDGSFDSHPNCRGLGILEDCFQDGDEPERRTFAEPGNFPYHCRVHGSPGGQGMAGVIAVGGDEEEEEEEEEEEQEASSTTTKPDPAAAGPAADSTTTTETTLETTTTTRELSTSSTVTQSTTTAAPAPTATFEPAEAPSFDPEDGAEDVDSQAAGSNRDDNTGTVAVIVAVLLGVALGGGLLLWRLRPRPGNPAGPKP